MQAKRNMKKKIKHFTLIGIADWCSFNPESPNSSSRYRELHNQGPALRQGKKEIEKESQTFHTHKASCLVQLQPRVTKFKLSLSRAS
jgi:hypothetical protein